MLDQDKWVSAICDAPDDDAPRLDYSKWLTQRGVRYGEFIRLQCEIAGLAIENPRYRELDHQLLGLLNAHEQEWLGALRGLVSDWTFARGFLTSITVDGSRYFLTSDGRTLYRSPLKSADLADLLELLPPTLTTLVLRGNNLGPLGAQALVEARQLKLLTGLDVSGFQSASKPTDWDLYEENVGSSGARILAESSWASQLLELDLSLNRIDNTTAAMIAASPHLKDLRRLTIHESNDEPYATGKPYFSDTSIESLRAAFGDRLSLRLDCPAGTFTREERRKAVS